MLDRVLRSKITANEKTIDDLVSTNDRRSSSYHVRFTIVHRSLQVQINLMDHAAIAKNVTKMPD